MIDFVVMSSDLRPYVLDTLVKRGDELSTDHHLEVSRIRWQGRKLDRPGRPKRIVRVCWERLAEPSVREVFNSHLRESYVQILREAGDIGPHLSNERTAEKSAYDHFHANFGIYQFGRERKLRSNLMSGLSSCTQI